MPVRFEARQDRFGCKLQRDDGSSLRLDNAGRWSSARFDNVLRRRTLDGKVVRVSGPEAFTTEEPGACHATVARLAKEFAERLPDLLAVGELDRDGLLRNLRRASQWTPERYEEEARKFHRAYPEAVEILPPDRYRDLVVLPALGCPNSTCTFCAFYQNRRFRLLDEDAFATHVERVREFFGDNVGAKDGVFLGSASALSLGQRPLVARLGHVADSFGTLKRGVAAFWDPDHCPERTAEQWSELAALGLSVVYLGLETGFPALRTEVGKSEDLARVIRRTHEARAGGVRIGVMVLAGVGSAEQFDAHCAHSAQVVRDMDLSRRDIVFVSPLRGERPDDELDEEARRLHQALASATDAKVAPYAAERFHYYA